MLAGFWKRSRKPSISYSIKISMGAMVDIVPEKLGENATIASKLH